jgi:hypothetical protein
MRLCIQTSLCLPLILRHQLILSPLCLQLIPQVSCCAFVSSRGCAPARFFVSNRQRSAPVHPSPDIIVPLVDPALPADLVSAVSTTDPMPSVNPPPTVTITLKEAAKLRATYTHFRILVIGRANAGKTTLLKRVCNTKEDPVYNCVSYQFILDVSLSFLF